MANIPEGYDVELWDITFCLVGEDGEALQNPDGSVRLFRETDVDWSFLELNDIPQEVFFEVEILYQHECFACLPIPFQEFGPFARHDQHAS